MDNNRKAKLKTHTLPSQAAESKDAGRAAVIFSKRIAAKYFVFRKMAEMPAFIFLKLFIPVSAQNKITNNYQSETINNHINLHFDLYLKVIGQSNQILRNYNMPQTFHYPMGHSELNLQPEKSVFNPHMPSFKNISLFIKNVFGNIPGISAGYFLKERLSAQDTGKKLIGRSSFLSFPDLIGGSGAVFNSPFLSEEVYRKKATPARQSQIAYAIADGPGKNKTSMPGRKEIHSAGFMDNSKATSERALSTRKPFTDLFSISKTIQNAGFDSIQLKEKTLRINQNTLFEKITDKNVRIRIVRRVLETLPDVDMSFAQNDTLGYPPIMTGHKPAVRSNRAPVRIHEMSVLNNSTERLIHRPTVPAPGKNTDSSPDIISQEIYGVKKSFADNNDRFKKEVVKGSSLREINTIADRVYKIIEKRIAIEKERRGL